MWHYGVFSFVSTVFVVHTRGTTFFVFRFLTGPRTGHGSVVPHAVDRIARLAVELCNQLVISSVDEIRQTVFATDFEKKRILVRDFQHKHDQDMLKSNSISVSFHHNS